MNLEKNRMQETMDEEGDLVAHSRSSRVMRSYVKIGKPSSRKFRPKLPPAPSQPDKVEMMREPGPPPKAEQKPSQAASWDHLKKQERQSRLRAPVSQRRGSSRPQ